MKYQRIKYPDGQISARITDFSPPLVVRERILTYEDLMFVRALADVMEHRTEGERHLEIVCLLAQRSDTRFAMNESFDLRLVAEVINAANYTTVTILDPHSTVATGLIRRSSKVDPFPYIKQVVDTLYNGLIPHRENLVLVAPDAGAYKKVYNYGNQLSLPVIGAVKCRDAEGKPNLQITGDVKDKACLIIDDICDGGATFLSLAGKLKEAGAEQVFLYVTHGYFSKGFGDLEANIEHIFCTNSVKDIKDEFVTQYKVI